MGLCVVLTSVGATPQPYIPEDDAAVLLDIPRNAAMLRGLAERQLSENQAVALARLLLAEHRQAVTHAPSAMLVVSCSPGGRETTSRRRRL